MSDQASVIIVCVQTPDNDEERERRERDKREREEKRESKKVDRHLSLSSSSIVCLSCVDKFSQFYFFLTANIRLIVNARTIFSQRFS